MLNDDIAAEFIRAAEADLTSMEESRYFGFKSANSACYHAQQYAEKMIKARLIQLGYKNERTHNLVHLIEKIEDAPDIELAKEYCLILTSYESRSRYPDDGYRIFSPEEAEIAYEMALKIPYLIGIYETPFEARSEPRRRGWFQRLHDRLSRRRCSICVVGYRCLVLLTDAGFDNSIVNCAFSTMNILG